MPTLKSGLTWTERLLDIMTDLAKVMEYVHHSRYYDEHDEKYRECIIRRDLKPDNILLTKEFECKLADFGEARALGDNVTMSVVGTPLYVAPEVMKSERDDKSVDVFSFSLCLVACIRGEKTLHRYLLEALRKDLRRKSRAGIGNFLLQNKVVNKKWHPVLARRFTRCYRNLSALIEDC